MVVELGSLRIQRLWAIERCLGSEPVSSFHNGEQTAQRERIRLLAMAPEEDLQIQVGRKLTKRRKHVRASSVQYPERLREGEDVQEDVTAMKGKPAQYMNQSVFSMIAAAGSKTDFHARFEGEGSDSEDEQEVPTLPPAAEELVPENPPNGDSKRDREHVIALAQSENPQGKPAEYKGPHSLLKLRLRTVKEKDYMSQSLSLSPEESSLSHGSPKGVTPRDAPLMSKMLEAQADFIPLTQSVERMEGGLVDIEAPGSRGTPVSLADRLMDIFGLDRPEEVISGVSN